MEKIKVDFSGVEESGYDVVPGRYTARVEKIDMKEGGKGKYLEWTLKLLTGASKGMTIIHRTSLVPAALFGLRDMLTAMGITVPKSAVTIDPSKFLGKTVGVEVAMRPYEGKDYPTVKKVFNPTVTTEREIVSTDMSVPFDTSDPSEEVSIDLE